MVDLLLRHGADEMAIGIHDQAPADVIGSGIGGEGGVAEDVQRVHKLFIRERSGRQDMASTVLSGHVPCLPPQREGAALTRERPRP